MAAENEKTSNQGGGPGAVTRLGAAVINSADAAFTLIGGMSLLLAAAAGETVKGLLGRGQRFGWSALWFQMVRVGVRAIPIIILVELAIGMILPLQMFPKLDEFGQGEQIATVNAIAAFRELGALLTAVVLSGFAGASIAAELGTMVTNEEIKSLEAMALSPVRFLVVPRMLATTVMMVVLTVFADLVMIIGGFLTGVRLGIDARVYYDLTVAAVDIASFVTGLVKAGIFGVLISLIACFLGLGVKEWEGSEGVGKATTNTVVYSIVAIIGADAVFTIIFFAYDLF